MTYLGVDSGTTQLVLHDHDDDAEHAHDESVVTDPLPLLKQRLAPAQAVAHVGLVLAVQLPTGPHARPLADAALFGVLGVLGVDAHQRYARLLLGLSPLGARPSLHGSGDGHRRHWLPELKQSERWIHSKVITVPPTLNERVKQRLNMR